MMFEYGGSWSGWGLALMWLAMVAFWGVIIWAVYLVVAGTSRHRTGGENDNPQLILDRRLAKGEIDEDEYRRARDLLDSSRRTLVGGGGR
jgi:putative membrane protein